MSSTHHIIQNIPGILNPFGHFRVSTFNSTGHRQADPFFLFVNISDDLGLIGQNDLSFVLKTDLYALISESKQNSPLGP